ncbi:MAG: cell division protein SepF [Synechococcaceae cyanobacterium]|nr:cell division protein SepF [Synechococcaceae cyanobacterium]
METPFGSWSPEVVVMTPGRFEEAELAVEAVQQMKTVVLHLGGMRPEEAQRTIDFVSGGVYAMDGQSERLAEAVFLFAPALVTIERDDAGDDGPSTGD